MDAWTTGLWLPTALLALAATALAALLGIPVGWTLARGRKGKGLLLGLVLAQALLPTTLASIGWIAAFGAHGTGWTVLVWGFCFWPLAALGTWAGLGRAEARMEEAALLAMPPWRAALGVSLPRAAPSILASLAAAFILMLGDLGAPGCLQVPVGAEEVHARFSATWDAREALRMSLPMLALSALAAFPLLRIRRSLGGGGGGGVLRFPGAPAWGIALGSLSIPAYGMLRWALQGKGFQQASGILIREGSNTLILAGAVGILAPLLGFAVVSFLHKRSWAMAIPSCILFAAPGTIVGILLIVLLNGTPLYGTFAMPLLAALLRSFAPALLLAWRAAAWVPASYDEMGRLCGLPSWRRALSISFPLCLGGLAAGALVSAVVASGEVAATSLVCPPGFQTLAGRLFSLIHYGADAAVGAAALMGMAFVTVLGLMLSRTRA